MQGLCKIKSKWNVPSTVNITKVLAAKQTLDFAAENNKERLGSVKKQSWSETLGSERFRRQSRVPDIANEDGHGWWI